jgi:ABC-2 type transport system permease protein
MLMRWLRAINAENIKEWKIELAYKPDFIRTFIEPLIYVLPYVFYGIAIVGGRNSENLKQLIGNADVITYTVLGYIVMGFLGTACWAMGWALRKEQWYGTLETVFCAPVPRWVYIAGMATHSTLHQGLMIFVQAIVIHTIFHLTLNVSGLFPSLILIGFMLIGLYGLGIMVAALALIFKEGWIVSEIIHSIISIVTPIAYPLAVLPIVLRKVSVYLPTTYGIMGTRHFLMGENVFFSTGQAFLRLFLFGILWIAVGLIIFKLVDNKVRRDGTLSYY